MKKFGFTLAEVLITLGIIGVVAALTAPALVQNAGTAKVGPTLAKVVSTLEIANEHILKDEEATDLSKVSESDEEYCELLSKYIAGSSYETNNAIFEPTAQFYNGGEANYDDMFKEFHFSDQITILLTTIADGLLSDDYEPKGSFKGAFAGIMVDINGIKTKPNIIGKDIFMFYIDKTGQVIPYGSNTYAWLLDNANSDSNNKYTATAGNLGCNEDYVGTGIGCAGSIFENNLKVIYQ